MKSMVKVLILGLTVCSLPLSGRGQQIHMTTPKQSLGSSFNESIGCSWGLQGRGWSLDVGGHRAQPMFGNYQPGGGLNAGANFAFGNTRGYFNGWASQSYEAYNTMEAPSVTIMNGQYGSFQDVTDTPFVTGVVPVVGMYQPGANYGYVPRYNPQYSVLQEKINRLEQEKKQPALRPARGEEPQLRRQVREQARERAVQQTRQTSASSSRMNNPGTAERPAMSVAEMKRLRAQQKR